MDAEKVELPDPSERTITLDWAKAKDTLIIAMIGLLSTLALNTLSGLRGAVEKLTDKVELIVGSQGVMKDHADTQDRRLIQIEDRMMFLERQESVHASK